MAPISAAERQQKRREKLKQEGAWDCYKEKNRKYVKECRERSKNKIKNLPRAMKEKLINAQRKNNRDRVMKWRAQKKISNKAESLCYSSKAALGKAVARVKRALPSTPRRKQVVVRRLFYSEVNEIADNNNLQAKKESKRSHVIHGEPESLIKKFYEQDDISRQAPGRKDVVIVRENGIKLKIQARHLVMSVKEAYNLFKMENPLVKVGKSKFSALRPQHVLLSSKLPHNVCLCKYHENVIGALNVLSQHDSKVSCYSQDFVATIICKMQTEDCWLNKCKICKDGKGFIEAFPDPDVTMKTVTWFQWRKENNRECKIMVEGSI